MPYYDLDHQIADLVLNGGAPGGSIPLTDKGAPNGVALLDAGGQVPLAELGHAPSGLTGNIGDDVFALSAGTGQKLSLTGGSAAASLAAGVLGNVLTFGPGGTNAPDGSYTLLNTTVKKVGDGTGTALSAVYSTLAAAQVVYPFATALTQTVDFCALQLGINTYAALHGTLFLPQGGYNMGDCNTSRILIPFHATNEGFTLRGANGGSGQADVGNSTLIFWNSALDLPGGSAPHLTFAIDGYPCDALTVRDLSIRGPSKFSFNSGRLPCALAGLHVQSSSLVENVTIAQFSTALGYGGGTSGGFPATKGFDHSRCKNLRTNNVGYGIHLLPGSNTAGDQRFYDLQVAANCAVFAIAASASSGMVGTNVTGAGCYAPVGIFLYDDDSHSGAQVLGNEWENASFELSYNAAFYGQRLANPGGSVFAKNVMKYFFQGPHSALAGWASPGTGFAVTAVPGGGTGNQMTIADNNGVQWELGMQVTDITNAGRVPAGTVITAVNGFTTNTAVRANWPYNNPTITLSNNFTADPTGDSMLIIMPKLGNIVAFSIHDNTAPSFSQGYPPYPAYYTPAAGQINDNVCWDTNQTLNAATLNAQTSGPTYNTTWGNPAGTLIGSGQMANGVSCLQGDLLMYDAGGKKLVLCDGVSSPPVGAAVLAASAGGNVDFYIRGSFPNYAFIRNKTGGTILANAFVKPDTGNPGGVTTAANWADNAVGVLGATPLTTGNIAAVGTFRVP